jgi:hypothetical protein
MIRFVLNTSVVTFCIDGDLTVELPSNSHKHSHFELHVGEHYDCRMTINYRAASVKKLLINITLTYSCQGFHFIMNT